MTQWLAGMRITAARLNDGIDATIETAGVVDSANFTTTAFQGRKSGKVVTIMTITTRNTSAIPESAAGSGNLSPDVAMLTLPVGWRPPASVLAIFGNGANDGECLIGTDGLITLRTTSGSTGITAGTNVRVSASWITD